MKLKAGRIIPALVTTTAVVAGLVAAQLVQIVANVPVEKLKNSFVNLAVPFIAQAEPGPPPTRTLGQNVSYSLMSRTLFDTCSQPFFSWLTLYFSS